MQNKTYTIVGQGLVGSILAYIFHENNIDFKIYSNGVNHSTKVAAGLINPVVFKRLNKCFGADNTIPFAYTFYDKIEKLTNSNFIFKKDYCRIFASVEEENNWLVKQNREDFIDHLYPIQENKNRDQHEFEAPYGQGYVKNAGFMDTEEFLKISARFFKENNYLVEKPFEYNNCNSNESIIFCEGFMMKKNPYFSYLPLNTTKGDVIDISNFSKSTHCILNKGVFVLPLNKNTLRIGSTYTWNNDDPTPTEKGKIELQEKLQVLDNMEYDIVQHKAGIRPTVKDRRPLIGTHPEHKNLHVINGMGTRGVALAPFWVEQFVESLLENKKLPLEVDIRRFDNELNVD